MKVLPELYKHQKEALEFSYANKDLALFFEMGSGKCLGIDTPVLMYGGSISKVQDIKVGDQVMGPDSKPRTVKSLARGREELFEMTPVKGDTVIMNRSHIMTLRSSYSKTHKGVPSQGLLDISIDDYLNKFTEAERKTFKWTRTGVDFPAKDLEWDPYFVGMYLADGSRDSNQITNADFEVQEYLYNNFNIADNVINGIELRIKTGGKPGALSPLSKLRREIITSNTERLIPQRYKTGSRSQRLSLLAGILDGDGCVSNGSYDFITKYPRLRDDVLYLCRSLGLAAYTREKVCRIKSIGFEGVYHRISISGNFVDVPFKIERRKLGERKQKKSVLNTSLKLRSLGEGDYYGFTLSGHDNRFLLGDFSITHNTPTTINILRHDYANFNRIRKTIILGPIIVLEQWKQEFAKFSRIDSSEIVVLKGTGKKKAQQVYNLHGKNKIIITNYESLLNADVLVMLKEWAPEFMVCDEVHYVKNPNSKRSKRTLALSKLCDRHVILTGTPIANSVEDLFMEFQIMDGGATFGKNFYVFKNRYMVDANAAWSGRQGHFPKWVPNAQMFEELNHKVMSKALQAKKADCMDLPSFVRKGILVPMSAQQKKSYKQMEEEFITFLEEKEGSEESPAVVAQLALTKSMKLLQIASGFAIDEEGKVQTLKVNPKIEVLKNILEQITPDNKVIVWAHFRHSHKEIKALCDKMEIKAAIINGEVNIKEKNRILQDFRDEDSLRIIVASQGAAGTGTNMQAAGYSIYFSRDYSLTKDIQSEARNYRGGSVDLHEKVTRIDLMTEGTLDQLVGQALAAKQDIATQVLEYKKLIKEIK